MTATPETAVSETRNAKGPPAAIARDRPPFWRQFEQNTAPFSEVDKALRR